MKASIWRTLVVVLLITCMLGNTCAVFAANPSYRDTDQLEEALRKVMAEQGIAFQTMGEDVIPPPVPAPPAGTYTEAQSVSLGPGVWYTLDGSDPRNTDNPTRQYFSQNILISETATLTAAREQDGNWSDLVTATYTIVDGTHTVSFHSNGGTPVDSQAVAHDDLATEPAEPTRPHHDFAGWYRDEELTSQWDFASDTVTSALTLFAKWVPHTCEVSFNSNEGSVVSPQIVDYGSPATEPTVPIKPGHTFAGWYADADLNTPYDFDLQVTEDITLHAKWLVNYTVIFNPNGGDAVPDQVVPSGHTAAEPAAPTREGFAFAGWHADELLTVLFNFSTPITANITLHAKWTAAEDPEPVKLRSLQGGNTVQFAGHHWIVLNPATGYLLKRTAYGDYMQFYAQDDTEGKFDPADPNSIAHYLNDPGAEGGFYRGLSATDRALIESNDWTTGGMIGDELDEAASIAHCKIGLISFSEYGQYGPDGLNIITRLNDEHPGEILDMSWMMRTPWNYYWHYSVDGDTGEVYYGSSIGYGFARPAIYLNPEVLVDGGDGGTVIHQWENDIKSFTVSGQVGVSVIDATAHTVAFRMPYGSSVNALQPAVTVSAGAAIDPQSGVAQDFGGPVVYSVTAYDGSVQDWTVTCTVDRNSAKAIVAFAVFGQIPDSALIDAAQHTVTFRMPAGADVTALSPTMIVSDRASIAPAADTAQDFSLPVIYVVTAEDGSTQDWTITCTVAQSNAADIVSFAVPQQSGSTVYDPSNQRITFRVPYYVNATALQPAITVSPGATLAPASGEAQDFRHPVTYLVTAEDGITQQAWLVTCIVEPDDTPPVVVAPPVSLPTVSTGAASAVGFTEATLHGSITSSGGAPCTTVRFQYREAGVGSWQGIGPGAVSLGDGESFSVALPDLKPNTTYEFYASAANSRGWGEGSVETFTTQLATPAMIATHPASNVNPQSATLRASITSMGGSAVTSCGFNWGVDGEQQQTEQVNLTADGDFALDLSGLTAKLTYSFTPFAQNASGVSYGETLQFTTPASPGPAVETLAASTVEMTSALLRGRVTNNLSNISECGFYVNSLQDKVWVSAEYGPDSSGYFTATATDLTPGAEYHFAAYATNESGTGNGAALGFITWSLLPEVETWSVPEVKAGKAELRGVILKNKGLAITDSGFLWGTDPQPDRQVSVAPIGGRDLVYTLPEIEGGVTYYVTAYAANQSGSGYGETVSFTVPATVPTVITEQPSFTADPWSATLSGEVVYDGGAPLSEHGFLVGRDGEEQSKLVVGTNSYRGAFDASLGGLSQLPPGTYSVQAFASNEHGTARGEVLQFVTPGPAKLTAAIVEPIGATVVQLVGAIVDLGGEGFTCVERRFRYRPLDAADWIIVGVESGEFGAGEFRFDLSGLQLASTYELVAEAYNLVGWASSETVTFSTSYGLTDKEVAVNMKAAGFAVAEIARAIYRQFGDTAEQSIEALRYAGFGAVAVAEALQAVYALYYYWDAVPKLRAAGFDILEIAAALQQAYHLGKSYAHNLRPCDLVGALQESGGYDTAEILAAVGSLFDLEPAPAAQRVQFVHHTATEIHEAMLRLYGLGELANFGWLDSVGFDIESRLFRVAELLLQNGAGLASHVNDLLLMVHPAMTVEQMIYWMQRSSYGLVEIGDEMIRLFAPSVADVLTALTWAGFDRAAIEAWLVHDLGLSAHEMYQLVLAHWPQPLSDLPRIFSDYYQMNALDTARLLYQAGWTEANYGTGNGPGLRGLVRILADHYGLQSYAEIIPALRDLGMAPPDVATFVSQLPQWYSEFRIDDWRPAYRDQGYTAIDLTTWHQSTGDNPEQAIRELNQLFSLTDVIIGMRNAYQLTAAAAISHFSTANLDFHLGWSEQSVLEAVNAVYGMDPIAASLAQIRAAGQSATAAMLSLQDVFLIRDAERAASYVAQAGYGQVDVLAAVLEVYPQFLVAGNPLQVLLRLAGRLYQQDDDQSIGVILRACGCRDAATAVSLLRTSNYQPTSIAIILKRDYGSDMAQVFFELQKYASQFTPQQVMAAIEAAFGVDPIAAYVQTRRKAGDSARSIAAYLVATSSASSPDQLTAYLAAAGFPPVEVLQAMVAVFHQSHDAALLMIRRLAESFGQDTVSSIQLLLAAFQVAEPLPAIYELKALAHPPSTVVQVLQDGFGLTAVQALQVLLESQQYTQTEVLDAIQAAYQADQILLLISYRQAKGDPAATSFYRLQREFGITDTLLAVTYLLGAGYSLEAALEAVQLYAPEDLSAVIINFMAVSTMEDLATLYQNLLQRRMDIAPLVLELRHAFPDATTLDIARALEATGFSRGDSLWFAFSILGDDGLAAALRYERGLQTPGALAEYYSQHLRDRYDVFSLIRELRQAFPEATTLEIAQALEATGISRVEAVWFAFGAVGDDGLARSLRDELQLQTPAALAAYYYEHLWDRYNVHTLIQELRQAFPDASTLQIAQAIEVTGIAPGEAVWLTFGALGDDNLAGALHNEQGLQTPAALAAYYYEHLWDRYNEHTLVCELRKAFPDASTLEIAQAIEVTGIARGEAVRLAFSTLGDDNLAGALHNELGLQTPAALAAYYYEYLWDRYSAHTLIYELRKAFPEATTLQIALALEVTGMSRADAVWLTFSHEDNLAGALRDELGLQTPVALAAYYYRYLWGRYSAHTLIYELRRAFPEATALQIALALEITGMSRGDAIWLTFGELGDHNLAIAVRDEAGCTDPTAFASYYQEHLGGHYSHRAVRDELLKAFPDIALYQLAAALKAAGAPVYDSSGDGLFVWLRDSAMNSRKPDSNLAGMLGSHAEGLQLRASDAAELLDLMGYSLSEAVDWMHQNKYVPLDIFRGLASRYSSIDDYRTEITAALIKLKWSLTDIAQAIIAHVQGSDTRPSVLDSSQYRAYACLLEAGSSQFDAVRTMVEIGVPLTALADHMYEYSMRFHPRITAAEVAQLFFDVAASFGPETKIDISVQDIAAALAPHVHGGQRCWEHNQVVQGVMAIDGKVVSTAVNVISSAGLGVSGIIRQAAVLGILHDVGWEIEDAVQAMVEAHIGFLDAFIIGLAAGYSFDDTLSAVVSHRVYKAELSAKIAFSAMTFGFSTSYEFIKAAELANKLLNYLLTSVIKSAGTAAVRTYAYNN